MAIFMWAIAAAFILYSIFWAIDCQTAYMQCFLTRMGKRLNFMENLFFNIRTVKAFGWECVVQERLMHLRAAEVNMLFGFYKTLGVLYTFFFQFHPVMLLGSIWGYAWLYGSHNTAIFEIVPLIMGFKTALMAAMALAPQIATGLPSVARVEAFLKLPEAPRSANGCKSDWLETWPVMNPAYSETCKEADASLSLKIQGSFTWANQQGASLRDLDLSVQAGTSLAVIGKVGSGKSSLLNALTGELYPVGDARLSMPARVAYSAQVPYICEGTLKENVLYGEPFDEKRYNACLEAASLIPDIQVLPGGDQVPIGSRGISLSGGQKARVSMARAAYSFGTDAVLIDDPFGAVDTQTARHLLNEYVHGAILRDRAKVIVCQPDPEKLKDFDKVAILSRGRIVAWGSPVEVMKTKEYHRLLNQFQTQIINDEKQIKVHATGTVDVDVKTKATQEIFQLREDEFQHRPDFQTLKYFLDMGGASTIGLGCLTYLVTHICTLRVLVVLQYWASENLLYKTGAISTPPNATTYLWHFLAWWAGALSSWCVSWALVCVFVYQLSTEAGRIAIQRVFCAPVDRFFDKTPVGRIMNRFSQDLTAIDTSTVNYLTQLVTTVYATGVPLIYLHILMPFYFTLAFLPVYYILSVFLRRFWNTMVPVRYLAQVSRSDSCSELVEVDTSNAFVRASGKCRFRSQEFYRKLQTQLKAECSMQTTLSCWLLSRVYQIIGFFMCTMVLMAIWVPGCMTIGAFGICLTNMFILVSTVDTDIEIGMKAQFEFISMIRLKEYCFLEQEAAQVKDSDKSYKNFSVVVKRANLGALQRRGQQGQVIIVQGRDKCLLKQTDGNMFMAPEPQGFQKLDPRNAELMKCQAWHRLVAVNGKYGNFPRSVATVDRMVEELCKGKSVDVVLQIDSGWLRSGAHLEIQDLVAGYGDLVSNVLENVNIDIQPRTKVGVVGKTGCGKSTLLLSILRILEPRAGRIFLNGVDTKNLGLQCLRTSIGMVPQDPVLMTCSVRDNLDPFGQCDDDALWVGLEMVQLKEHIESLDGGLDFQIQIEGGSLSFGQRQLLCMARLVIKQYSFILLDEATSALDPATQQHVQRTIETHFPDSTLLMIAHRLETIANFDKIVVMASGKVEQQGTLKELIDEQDGLFAKMWAAKAA